LVSAGNTVLGVVGLTEGYGEGPKFVEITAAVQKAYEPGTGEIPPNSLQVAPFAGPETLASSSPTMSAMKRKWCHARVMSVLPLKADIPQREWHVR
jgi:hypothetical protein